MSTSCRIPWIVSYLKNSLSFLWQCKNLLTIYLTIPFCVRVHFWNQEIWIKGIFIEPFEKLLLKEQLHSAANFEDRWYKRTLPFKYIRSLHGRDIGGTIFFLRLSFDKSKHSCEKCTKVLNHASCGCVTWWQITFKKSCSELLVLFKKVC